MNLLQLAKLAVENHIKEKKIIDIPTDIPKEFLEKRAGVFITIQQEKELRGCIGTYLPTKRNIAEEVIHNAVAAASEDYRFSPITKIELPHLSYTIYILSEPSLVKDIKELNPEKYGIIIKTVPVSALPSSIFGTDFASQDYSKSGLLLPGLEGIDTVEKQISIACQKADINPEKEKFLIYKFVAEKYCE